MDTVTTALAVGGGAYVVSQAQGASSSPAPSNVAPNGGVLIQAGAASSGSTISQQLASGNQLPVGNNTRLAKLVAINRGSAASGVVGVSPTAGWGSQVSPTNGIDPVLQQKLDMIKDYAKAAYINMDQAAKKAGAKALNEELKLDPPLDGTEDWEKLAATAGGAAGAAALGWIPGGAYIGAIAGAYLGVKIEELISKNADEIKEWFSSRWNQIEDWVKDAYNDVEGAISDAIDYIGGWF